MRSALVTGGAGFIGSHIVDRLIDDGEWFIRIFDNFSSGRIENIKHYVNNLAVEVIIGDLKNSEEVFKALKDIDVVFHFAANPEVRVSALDPVIHFNENIVGSFNLLEAMRKRDVKEIVFASSSSVYGEPEKIPVNEEAPVKPVSIYGASKAACENLIYAYSRLYGLKAVVLRYANVVGPRLRHGVIYDFIMKLLKEPSTLEILGDGTQLRSYIHVNDAVEATFIAWKKSVGNFDIYNVGSEDWITVNEVAEITIKTMGLKNVKYIYKPVLHGVGWLGDVKKIALSIDKLKNLGWKSKMNSKEVVTTAVKEVLKDFKQYGI